MAEDKSSNQLEVLIEANQALPAEIALQRGSVEELELLVKLYRALIEAEALPSAVTAALQIVCQFAGWDLGVAWLPEPGETELRLFAAWHLENRNLAEFVNACQENSFPREVGMPGRVWMHREPEWTTNLAAEPAELFPSAPFAARAGIRAVLGVPVLHGDNVLAVLLFHMLETKEKDSRLIEVVSAVAAQLGFALHHKHIGETLQRNQALLRQSREELEIRVEERTRELARANQGLEIEIAERKRSEEEMRRSESWLHSLIGTTQDAVLSIDRRGCVVLFNPGAERIFGYAAEEIVGRKVNELMAEPYASEHDGYIARYERTGEARAIGRIRTVTAKRKNGELFPTELSVTEIEVDQDVHYAAFIRDISEKAKLQQQLVESERLAAIGTTAAKIGHELANPLNGMSLTIQLLEQRLKQQPDPPDSQVTATVKRLKDEISRLNQLAGQFRLISRRERYDFHPTELAGLIDDVVKIQRPDFDQLNIKINQLIPTDLPTISVDKGKIKQALLNLLKNAAEAMPGGGEISIEVRATEQGVLIEITDTGMGIPLDIDAFEPFVTTKKEGTGIGLVIVRQIVTAHGGNVFYRSRAGEGTTFRIELARKTS